VGNKKKEDEVPKTLRLLPVSSGSLLTNKKLDKHMAQITFSSLSIALAMLPALVQDQMKQKTIELCVFHKRDLSKYESVLDEKKKSGMGKPKLNSQSGKVSVKRGNYDWVRMKNGPLDRLERLTSGLLTEQAVLGRGYVLPSGKTVELTCVDELLAGTTIKRITEDGRTPKTQTGLTTKLSSQESATVMDAAMRMSKAGKAVVAVNAASAYHVGGGVLTGGRHALEEAWCTTSTLLKSLQVAYLQEVQQKKYVSSTSTVSTASGKSDTTHAHIPVDGVILSPSVEVFRDSSNNGYGFQEKPTKLLGVVSVALFNMNPRVWDAPVDAPRDFALYKKQVKQKFQVLLRAATQLGAEVLVIPDVGCGVFENDPTVLGALLGEALMELPGYFQEVIITGKLSFFEAASRAFKGEKLTLKPSSFFTENTGGETVYGATGDPNPDKTMV